MRQIIHETDDATLWWREEGFWHYRQNPYREATGDRLAPFYDAIAAHAGTHKAPLLIDRTYEYTGQFSAWQVFQQRAPDLISAVAFYVTTSTALMAVEVLRDAFLKGWTVGLFRDLESAEAWLREQAANP